MNGTALRRQLGESKLTYYGGTIREVLNTQQTDLIYCIDIGDAQPTTPKRSK